MSHQLRWNTFTILDSSIVIQYPKGFIPQSLDHNPYLAHPYWIFTRSPHLLHNRPLQIVCTVKTMHLNCTQIVLRILENLSTVLIPLCKNKANLLHGPLYFKKIKTTTTTAFSISSTFLNPHNHVTVFDPQPFAPYLKFQVSLVDLSQSDIQIFYLL